MPWTPPKVGATLEYAGTFNGAPLDIEQTVTAVEGDVVYASGTTPGHEDEQYYRFLVSLKSGDIEYRFDTAEVAALWPLAPGKSVTFSGVA